MILLYRPLSIAPRFWIIAGGILVISFLSGHLLAPAYIAHLRSHPQEPTLLSPSQIVGHGYTPPTGEALLKERQDSFVHFKSFLRPNIVSASICLALGAVVFFFPSIWIALQGLLFGVLSFIDGWPMFLSRMMPHSLLEIPLAVFTAAAATQIGWTIFRSWKSGCRRVCAEEVRSLGVVWLQVSGLLVIAAILESYVRLHVFL